MIMGGDKKKMASFIVDKIGGKKDDAMKKANESAYEKMAGEPESEMDEGMLAAAEEVQAAIGGSPEVFAKALQNFFYMCDGKPHVEDGEELPELG
jgi:hypothetical protein